MATAPKVQTLAEAMAELNPAFAQGQQVIQKRQAGLGAKYDAQRSAIYAERGEGFNTINDQAVGRGGAFSGVPVHEQSRYLSTKFLPGLQQADYQQNDEDLQLQGQLADINKEIGLGAVNRIDRQTGDLNQWNLNERNIETRAEQERLQREFQANENRLSREASAAEAAASRASQASIAAANRAANEPRAVDPFTAALGVISQSRGTDGYVSPSTFQVARDLYRQAGGSASDFASQFWKYTGADKGGKNESNWRAYYYG